MTNININSLSIQELHNKTLNIVKSYTNSCRLCLQKQTTDNNKFVSIFQQIDTAPNYSNYSLLAKSFANLEISEHDKYPKIICQKCAEQLQLFHEFRKKCELTQIRLIAVITLGHAIKKEKIDSDDNDNGSLADDHNSDYDNDDDDDSWHDEYTKKRKNIKKEPSADDKTEICHNPIKLKRIQFPLKTVADDIQFQRIVKNSYTKLSDGTKKLSQTIILKGEQDLTERLRKKREQRLAHDRAKRFQCEECGSTFARKADLAQHSHKHTGIKPWQCDICKKCFTRKSHLVAHFLIHNAIKPYTCDICGNSFRKLSNMARHKEHTHTHTSVFKYSCEICGRMFKRLSGVQHHMRVHTGQRPYKCETCPNAYKSHSGLRKHKRRLHAAK